MKLDVKWNQRLTFISASSFVLVILIVSILFDIYQIKGESYENKENISEITTKQNVIETNQKDILNDKQTESETIKAVETNANQEDLSKFKIEPYHDLSQFRKIKVVATGYYAGVESTGKDPSHPQYGITYSGVTVRRDLFSTIAADPEVFPLGTILFVPGYGYGVVADTGSAIKGNIIDLYFETKQAVFKEWGKKSVDVYVIRQGNGKVTEAMMNQLNETRLVQAGKLEQ